MKTLLKKMMMRTSLGRDFFIRRSLFRSASEAPFNYLNVRGKKKKIDQIYEDTFGEIFIMLKSFSQMKGDFFEFGVYKGFSALLLARLMKKFEMDTSDLYLFDSFEGFPKASGLDQYSYEYRQGVWTEGAMTVANEEENRNKYFTYMQSRLKKELGSRVHLVKGFFEETLEKHLASIKEPKAKLIHMDCDIYSSTKYVLDTLFKHNVIQDGTCIIFDDWMGSYGNPLLGQRRAVQEIMEKYPSFALEKYGNYGLGSHIFIAHDLSVLTNKH